jgi:hypothetical protein
MVVFSHVEHLVALLMFSELQKFLKKTCPFPGAPLHEFIQASEVADVAGLDLIEEMAEGANNNVVALNLCILVVSPPA